MDLFETINLNTEFSYFFLWELIIKNYPISEPFLRLIILGTYPRDQNVHFMLFIDATYQNSILLQFRDSSPFVDDCK